MCGRESNVAAGSEERSRRWRGHSMRSCKASGWARGLQSSSEQIESGGLTKRLEFFLSPGVNRGLEVSCIRGSVVSALFQRCSAGRPGGAGCPTSAL